MVRCHGQHRTSVSSPDKILAVGRDVISERDLGIADLLILLEGDVPADHVVEEDTQGPDGGLRPQVPGAPDPLWWGVDPGAFKLRVVVGLEKSAAAEVDQLKFSCLEIDQNVLILDISVDDSSAVAGQDCLNNLTEEVSSELLIQASLLTDVVKHVHTITGMLQYVDEGVFSFEKVQYFNNSAYVSHRTEKFKFKRHFLPIELKIKRFDFPHLFPFLSFSDSPGPTR